MLIIMYLSHQLYSEFKSFTVQYCTLTGTFPTLVAAMAVVAAVCVMGVSYFAWNSRKRGAVRDYQRLTVTAED